MASPALVLFKCDSSVIDALSYILLRATQAGTTLVCMPIKKSTGPQEIT